MHRLTRFLLPAIAASLLLAACGSSSSSTSTGSSAAAPTDAIVKTASNTTLGSTVLVDSQGLTLYRLSGEQSGKWICTSKVCLQAWHPLATHSSATPSGTVGSLAAIKRPDGTWQVTYKGMPLYTFSGDRKAGQAKGQGIKDVGTWNAVTSAGTASTAPAQTTTSPASGGGYGY